MLRHAASRLARTRGFCTAADRPYVMMVTVTVPDDRKAEFLKVLDSDVRGSRFEEDGCLRMDLLQDEADESKYYFYMAYKNKAALDAHRDTEHYQAWSAFRASGGISSQVASKAFAVDFQMP
uniref:ABM domain-containing protein n=1 Tax=Prymnesium polylepis TaxID=72548 RepID=A0A7S4M2R4_9EUKA